MGNRTLPIFKLMIVVGWLAVVLGAYKNDLKRHYRVAHLRLVTIERLRALSR